MDKVGKSLEVGDAYIQDVIGITRHGERRCNLGPLPDEPRKLVVPLLPVMPQVDAFGQGRVCHRAIVLKYDEN